ncbi:nucleolar and spindle-associated protein 1 [Centroberyx affinis]|uniref:nucleolar and spindle-associated protein 1 n=1 Tax=Centroberyx affinis TaxID=166261 RepID=UPI003A5BFF29
MDLDSMKYAELRSLAKELGLKGNMKTDKLLKAIKQHYQQEEQEEDGKGNEKGAPDVQEDINGAQENVQEEDAKCDEPVSSTTVFVTKRRGKGKRTRGRSLTLRQEPSVIPTCRLVQQRMGHVTTRLKEATKDNEEAESSALCGTGGAKRRRVSSTRESGTAEPPEETLAANSEQQPEIKDEAPAPCDRGNEPKVAKAGKIPRHEGLLKKTKPLLKPNTPNFKKLHEAHFNKMESIDSYVQRKTKQMDTYRNSVKELKMLSEKTISNQTDGKIQPANRSRASMFSPAAGNKRPAGDKRRLTALSASKPPPNKPAVKEDAPFRPSVLSTRRINVRFSQATQDNEQKRSLVKTPARMSPFVTSSTPQKQSNDGGKPNNIKTSTLSATKTPATFVFNGNTSVSNTPGTNMKPSFDLKASLSRPLTYKPHKGKLKPFGETKENTGKTQEGNAGNKSLISHSHQKNYKQHQVQTREERRTKHKEDRKQKKENLLGARRGLVMA